jgi:hypothetical protein
MNGVSGNRGSIVGFWGLLPPVVAAILIATIALAGRGQAVPRAAGPISDWSIELGHVERELAAGQIAPAIRSWERALGGARGSRQWQGLVAVGDAYLRIGDAVELRRAFVATARGIYLEALERAGAAASVEGVLRIAAVLAAVDDGPDVEQAIRAACRAANHRGCEGQPRIDPREDAS